MSKPLFHLRMESRAMKHNKDIPLKQPGQSAVSIGLCEEWIALDSQFVVGDAPVQVPSVQPRVEPIGCRY